MEPDEVRLHLVEASAGEVRVEDARQRELESADRECEHPVRHQDPRPPDRHRLTLHEPAPDARAEVHTVHRDKARDKRQALASVPNDNATMRPRMTRSARLSPSMRSRLRTRSIHTRASRGDERERELGENLVRPTDVDDRRAEQGANQRRGPSPGAGLDQPVHAREEPEEREDRDQLELGVVDAPERDDRGEHEREAPRIDQRAEAVPPRVVDRVAVVGDDLADVAFRDPPCLVDVEREVVAPVVPGLDENAAQDGGAAKYDDDRPVAAVLVQEKPDAPVEDGPFGVLVFVGFVGEDFVFRRVELVKLGGTAR